MEIVASTEKTYENEKNLDKNPVAIPDNFKGAELNCGDFLDYEDTDAWWRHNVEDTFFPPYNENLTDLGALIIVHDSSAYQKDDSLDKARMEIFSSTERTDEMQNLDKNLIDIPDNFKGAESNSGDRLDHENTDDFRSRHDIFLPTYNENLRDLGAFDLEVEFVYQASELEQSDDDIFKTWELDMPPEEGEDDPINELNKYLAESSFELTDSVPDDSKVWIGLKDELIDDLIYGIADLSLSSISN